MPYIHVNYLALKWNPKGTILSMICMDMRPDMHIPRKLGIYRLDERKTYISDIPVHSLSLAWKDDATLYISEENKVNEVHIGPENIEVVHTIPLSDGRRFLGIIDNTLITIDRENTIQLGDNKLIKNISSHYFIATESNIFVSTQKQEVVAFDRQGREISREKTKNRIKFGSIGRDPDEVYGMAGNVLVKIRTKNKNIEIEEIYDFIEYTKPLR